MCEDLRPCKVCKAKEVIVEHDEAIIAQCPNNHGARFVVLRPARIERGDDYVRRINGR